MKTRPPIIPPRKGAAHADRTRVIAVVLATWRAAAAPMIPEEAAATGRAPAAAGTGPEAGNGTTSSNSADAHRCGSSANRAVTYRRERGQRIRGRRAADPRHPLRFAGSLARFHSTTMSVRANVPRGERSAIRGLVEHALGRHAVRTEGLRQARERVGDDDWHGRLANLDVPELDALVVADPRAEHVARAGAFSGEAVARSPREGTDPLGNSWVLQRPAQFLPVFLAGQGGRADASSPPS